MLLARTNNIHKYFFGSQANPMQKPEMFVNQTMELFKIFQTAKSRSLCKNDKTQDAEANQNTDKIMSVVTNEWHPMMPDMTHYEN